jgi:polyisoprenoid-binding protein YceI
LGFKLPSRAFQFDQTQSFEVIPELSRVGFDAKSTLHDFTGVTTKVHGAFTTKLSDPAASFAGAIVCEAAGLDSGVEGRDEAMLEHLDAKVHPEIRFTVQTFTPDNNGVDAAKMTVKGTVTGLMLIRGVEKPLSMPVVLTVEPSRRVMIEGQAKVHLPDFAVPVPDKVVIKMQPDVTVWIALRARVAAGVERAK